MAEAQMIACQKFIIVKFILLKKHLSMSNSDALANTWQ